MKKNVILILSFVVLVSCVFSCKSEPEVKPLTEDEVMEYYDPNDSSIVHAYLHDKSTIRSSDIDLKDTTYSSRVKILYEANGNRLAVVYGLKAKEGDFGKAIIQLNQDNPIELKEIDAGDPNIKKFTDGKTTLVRSGEFAFIEQDGGSVQYLRIK